MANNKICMDKDCIKFFVNPPEENNKEKVYYEAIKRAYGDMSRHTLHFQNGYKGNDKTSIDNRNNFRTARIEDLKTLMLNGGYEDRIFDIVNSKDKNKYELFDDIHDSLCNKVIESFTKEKSIMVKTDYSSKKRDDGFSYGQAQKIVNMTLKYVYMFYNYFNALDNSYKDELDKFNFIIPYLHSPVDSYVIDAAEGEGANGKKSYNFCCKRPKYPWSKLSHDEYIDYINDLRENLKQKDTSPFAWELSNYPF